MFVTYFLKSTPVNIVRRLRVRMVLWVGVLCFLAPDSFGQAAEPPAITLKSPSRITPSSTAEEPTEIIVVGSRIRRTTFDSPSPIQVVTREEAIAAGFSSTTEMLQGTAVTSGAAQINNAFGAFVTDGGPGANTVSLRGLGASRTLVLINGRRVSPAGSRGAVGSADLNVLPTAIVDRVEVLKDGASSIYGSDAVGGVVNVITLDKVEGLSFEGQVNLPSEGGGDQRRFSITGGASGDRWSLAGSLDILDRRNLTVGERDWASCGADGFRDPETGETLDFIDPKTGKPKCNTISGTGTNGVTVNTIGTQSITAINYATLGLNGPVVGAAGSSGTTFSRFRPNPSITTGVVGYEGVGGGTNNLNVRDTFDPRMSNKSLISPATIYTSFLQGEYDLQALGDAKIYLEYLGHRRSSEQTGFRQLSLDYRRGSPLIPADLAFANFGPDQGTSEGQRVGVRAFIGFGKDTSEQTLTFNHPTLGIKGDITFLPDWKYDSYLSYSKSDAEYKNGSFFKDKVTYASDAVTAPVGTDPSLVRNGLTCKINLNNPSEKCILYPTLNAATVGGNLPQDFSDYIFRDVTGQTGYEESVFSATMDGPLARLPAGKLQGVFGLEHRRGEINDMPDPNSIAGNLYSLTSASPTVGEDYVTEAYTEIELPLLSKAPMAHELTANMSYRLTDYDSYGSDTTHKFGLVYSPSNWFSVRATSGTSFRAPALFEQFQGATSGFLSSTNDPCNNFGATGVSPTRVTNCLSEGLSPDFQATTGIKTLNVGGGKTGLEAETSSNDTIGIIFQPDLGATTDLSLAMDYFSVDIENGVAQAGADEILPRCYDDSQFRAGGGLCRLITRDANTKQLEVSDSFTNLSTTLSKGVDFTGQYKQAVGPGKLLIDISTTHYTSQAGKIFKEDPLEELNHTLMSPAWSGTGRIAYTIDKWRVSYGIDWIGDMDSYAYEEEDPLTSELDLEVPSYIKHRISVRYAAETWETTFGVRNLTNEEPPTISSTKVNRVGNAPLYSGYDYVGREFFVNLQMRF